MPPPPDLAPDSKPARILDAAGSLFLRDGYGGVSMDAVAREAGVSKATLYAHFDGKQALFATLVEMECAGLMGALGDEELRRRPPAAALTEIGRRFFGMMMSPRAIAGYRIVIGEAPRFPELARVFYEKGPAIGIARLAAYLAAADAAGWLKVPDPTMAAEQFLGMLKSHLHLRLLLGTQTLPEEAERERLIGAAVALFTRGYAP